MEERAEREHLLDEIDRTEIVDDFLRAAGLWSIRGIADFLDEADLDDLQNLKDDLEAYDRVKKKKMTINELFTRF